MSRRYVKTSKFNSLDQIKPEIVAVVTAKDNLQSVSEDQVYFKRNYLDAIRQIIPKFYFDDERVISGTQVSFPNQLVNSHILANKNQSTILPMSGLVYDNYLSSLNTPKGFAKYFSKQTPPAQIDTDDFERNILVPLGKSFNSFTTSSAFANYISGTFLPSIPLVCDGHHPEENLATLTASAFSNDSSGTYKYLVNNLGWLYFLNRVGPKATYGFDPSTSIAPLLVDTLWQGRSVVLEDTINVYQEYLWKNKQWWSNVSDDIIPVAYTSALDTPSGIYTSGVQLLDRLKTLNAVVYSPHYLDSPDTFVKDSFDTYLNTSTTRVEGTLITATQEAGPLARFLEAISFTISDRLTEEAEIGVLYDIGKCPQEFLELLGELIGWKFIGGDLDKWRVQLRNAVAIYKMKGTKKAIQYLLDTLFSTGVFNVTGTDTLNELWESYIPDLMYYSLATSSAALLDFKTYRPEVALQFGVENYSHTSMETNIKYIVDKILFDLVKEFPDSFVLGGKSFPKLELVIAKTDGKYEKGDVYTGPYHIMEVVVPDPKYPLGIKYMTGSEHVNDPPPKGREASVDLDLIHDPDFIFHYRDRTYLVPPYEKRQYYTQTRVSNSMIERIEYYLRCYGVDKAFAAQVADYMRTHLSRSLDVYKVINNFMIFTKEKTYPPNYAEVLKDATKQRTPDPVSLLSMWNGKSSHFLMNFNSSSFDWTTQALTSTSKYGLSRVLRVMDQVIPAHAIPEVLLTVSDVADAATALRDNDCREIRPNFTDLYTGSSTVTTNFALCAVDMGGLAVANNIVPHRFKRAQVDNVNDVLLSGSTFQSRTSARRNSLRRRNFHNLLPETKMFTRVGRNNPGSLELSTTYWSSGFGYIPLGFMPSSLKFKEVAIRQNDALGYYGIGQLIDRTNLHSCWEICKNLNSTDKVFGYQVSDTFASRAKQSSTTSDCNTYGRRGQLQEILYVMNKVHDQEKYLQASSLVSGFHFENGGLNPEWASSSPLITPMDFSAWYAERSILGNGLAVVPSIGNHLINKESADESLNYYENFTLGRKINELYHTYMFNFSGHGVNSNYNLMGGPNFFSHTFGPYLYNSDFDIDGSALNTSGWLAASSPTYEVDIAYYGGSGILSLSGMVDEYADLGTYAASTAEDLPLSYPEFRNNHLVSAIELVDTSSGTVFAQHPIFSIFNLSRDDQSKYSYTKYLINNQIIKYHRSESGESLPRLRIKIDDSDINNMARNFLQPDHDYEISVKAHNLTVDSGVLGGLDLACWIHTEPERSEVWSHTLFPGDRSGWGTLSIADLSGNTNPVGGIELASENSQIQSFAKGNLGNVIGSGEAGTGKGILTTTTSYDYRCWEPKNITTLIKGADPQAIANINAKTLNTLKFKFSTNNKSAIPSNEYRDSIGKVHRTNQKYTLEFFALAGHQNKFIVFEDISIRDITSYNNSVIQTQYGEAQLDSSDLKAVFIFLKGLSKGLASRNSTITEGTMGESGGSRLNYRSNIAMFRNSRDSNYEQLEEIEIDEG